MMLKVPLQEWLPDLPALNNPGMTLATNCTPEANGYGPFNSLSTVTDALTARPRGAISAHDKDGNTYTFAADATKIYQLSGTTWSDVTGTTLDPSDDENVEFFHYGETIGVTYYSTGSVEVRSKTLGAGGNFANLFTSTRKPRGRHGCVFKDFLILGGTYDTVDGSKPYRLWWSALGDIADMDPDAATQSDFQDLPADDGFIERVIATKEYVVVYQTKAITRMTYVGGDVIFDIQKMVHNRGCIPGGGAAVAASDRYTVAPDTDGIYRFDGTEAVSIGVNKVDKTFIDDATEKIDPSYFYRASAVIDPITKTYMLLYARTGDSGSPRRMLVCYLPQLKWSRVEFSAEVNYVFLDRSQGITLDGLDALFASIDSVTPTLDSRVWQGGAYLVGAFNSSHILGHFDGDELDARLETGEYQWFQGRRNYISEVWPYVDDEDAVVTVQIGNRNLQSESVTYTSASSVDAIGKTNHRSDARYSRIRINITDGFEHAQGCEVLAMPGGRR